MRDCCVDGVGWWVAAEHARAEENIERLSVCRMRTELPVERLNSYSE